MRLEWLNGSSPATCPVCDARGPKPRLLTTDHVREGSPPITLLRCPECGARFLADLAAADYEVWIPAMLDYYVEVGAGIDLIVEPLLRVPPGSVRRMLEVGCAFGFALDFARHALGWQVLGVDPSPLAAAGAEALGVPVRRAYLDRSTDLGSDPFDLVFCSEILEHVAAPYALLETIRERLAPGGVLILTTPNASIVRSGTSEGTLGRALSAGLHAILYDRDALALLLSKAGFPHVVVEQTPETLRAFASTAPEPIERLRPVSQETLRPLLRSYLARRADAASDPTLACGLAYRHFKECVNAGLYAEAEASRARLARIYRDSYDLDLDLPDATLRQEARVPFNLAGARFFTGILALNHHGSPARAAAHFSASIAAGDALQRAGMPLGLHDGETEGILVQSRKLLPVSLAVIDPERALLALERLERPASGGPAFPPKHLDEARRETFVRLVNAAAFAAAARLATAVASAIDLRALEEQDERSPGALDAPYCLAMLALHESRHGEAAELFALVARSLSRHAAPGREELLRAARHHEALCRERLASDSSGRTAHRAGTTGGRPLRGPARRIIGERFAASRPRLSGIDLPLDVIAREVHERLRIVVASADPARGGHREATIAGDALRPDGTLRLSFAPFHDAPPAAEFVLGVAVPGAERATPLDTELRALRADTAGRAPIALACHGAGDPSDQPAVIHDERAISVRVLAPSHSAAIRAAHAIEIYWRDPHGIFLAGWAHAHEHRVRAIRIESAGRSARIVKLGDRPDLLEFYPRHEHVRHAGFRAFLPCPAGHGVTLVLETEPGDAAIPLELPAEPIPAWPAEELSALTISPILRRFIDLVNERRKPLLQIGSRTPSGLEVLPPRGHVVGRVIGLDIHPGHDVDVVADAHALGRVFRPGSFSGAWSASVLEHLEAPWIVAREINRILEPGGLVYHSAPAAWPGHALPNDFWRFSSEGLRVLFGPASGFEVIAAGDSGRAAIVPGPGWRDDHLDMPAVPTFAFSEIVARKVRDLEPDDDAGRRAPAGNGEERSRLYPLDALRPSGKGTDPR